MDGIDDRLAAWLERDVLDLDNAKKGPRKLADYRVDREAASIDGLPAWPLDEPVVP